MLDISITLAVKVEFVDDCHFTILPVVPLNNKFVVLLPEHTELAPDIVPATDCAVAIIITLFENAGAEDALVTLAR